MMYFSFGLFLGCILCIVHIVATIISSKHREKISEFFENTEDMFDFGVFEEINNIDKQTTFLSILLSFSFALVCLFIHCIIIIVVSTLMGVILFPVSIISLIIYLKNKKQK